MARNLKILQISQSNRGETVRTEVGALSGEEVVIGREPGGNGIAINSHSISRKHGHFTSIRNHWFYRDLESTNGSWLNGNKLTPHQWCLIKVGDVLQLADIALEISIMPGSLGFGMTPLGIRSLIVFSRGSFLDEFPIPEYGRALVIGGSKADLKLDVDVHELPSLVVERRGDIVCAFSISKEIPVFQKGEPITHTVTLHDRDELQVDHYTILYNDVAVPVMEQADLSASVHVPPSNPSKGKPTLEYQADNAESETIPYEQQTASRSSDEQGLTRPNPRSQQWLNEQSTPDERTSGSRTADRSPFGRVSAEHDAGIQETVAMDAKKVRATIAGYDIHPAMRGSIMEPAESPLGNLEDKIWLVVGLLMVLALVGIVVWWMMN